MKGLGTSQEEFDTASVKCDDGTLSYMNSLKIIIFIQNVETAAALFSLSKVKKLNFIISKEKRQKNKA